MLHIDEIKIIKTIIKHSQIKEDYLDILSSSPATNANSIPLSFSEIHSSSFPISDSLFQNWISKGKEQIEFSSLHGELDINLIDFQKFEEVSKSWGGFEMIHLNLFNNFPIQCL